MVYYLALCPRRKARPKEGLQLSHAKNAKSQGKYKESFAFFPEEPALSLPKGTQTCVLLREICWYTMMRYLLISDIHANLPAFQAVLQDADGQYDKIWFLGDAVGYGPHPNECIELLASLDCLGIAGNHDWAMLGKLAVEHFNPDARRVLLWTRSVLFSSSLEFLDMLQISAVVEEQFTLVHGSPRHPIWEYVIHPLVAKANFNHFSTRYCLVGHTHSPATFHISDDGRRVYKETPPEHNSGAHPLTVFPRLIINPGSVGQPRDGDPRASYAIVDPGNLTIDYRRASYDLSRTQESMLELGFPARLIYRLLIGR
jgi:predicted phosphodiesterase